MSTQEFPPIYTVFDIRLYVEHADTADVMLAIENLADEMGFDTEIVKD